jgi:hypothetical protein
VVNGKVYVASANAVVVYGLLPGGAPGQSPPVIAAVENPAN